MGSQLPTRGDLEACCEARSEPKQALSSLQPAVVPVWAHGSVSALENRRHGRESLDRSTIPAVGWTDPGPDEEPHAGRSAFVPLRRGARRTGVQKHSRRCWLSASWSGTLLPHPSRCSQHGRPHGPTHHGRNRQERSVALPLQCAQVRTRRQAGADFWTAFRGAAKRGTSSRKAGGACHDEPVQRVLSHTFR